MAASEAAWSEFVNATGYVTVAERKPDWEELKKQLPPGTPKLDESRARRGRSGFRSAETEVLAAKSRLVGVGSGCVLEAPRGTGEQPQGARKLSRRAGGMGRRGRLCEVGVGVWLDGFMSGDYATRRMGVQKVKEMIEELCRECSKRNGEIGLNSATAQPFLDLPEAVTTGDKVFHQVFRCIISRPLQPTRAFSTPFLPWGFLPVPAKRYSWCPS